MTTPAPKGDPGRTREILLRLKQAQQPAEPPRDVSLRGLLPESVLMRLTPATAIAVKPLDLLTKTKLVSNKREAKDLLASGALHIDGVSVPSDVRHVDIHIGSIVQAGNTRGRLVP